jgi:hypothetical protein
MSTLKAKIYRVSVGGTTYFVYGTSRATAMNNVIDAISDDDSVRLATGEELFAHGRSTDGAIIAEAKYRRVVDPNQQSLPVDAIDAATDALAGG